MSVLQNSRVDWLELFRDATPFKKMIMEYKSQYGWQGTLFLPEFRELLGPKEFLVPAYIMWRKKIDSEDLLESETISAKRKKLIRKALAKSAQIGVTYKLVNSLTAEDFKRFFDYYVGFCEDMGYECLLKYDYFQKHQAKHLFLIEVWRGEEYLGGRLVCQYKSNLSTDYRAIARTREVQEGYDIVCEKMYYDLGAKLGLTRLGRGKELNFRGIGGKSIGMLWNKLKYGYQPVVASYLPRIYSDYSFLKDLKFDLFFFVSIENSKALWEGGEEVRALNFVCGDNPKLNEIRSVKEKSPYQVNVWDRDFNRLEIENLG